MKEYRRLKSIDGSGTIMRYYELEDDVAYTNCFYEIKDNKAAKINGTPTGGLIGFSHGGNALVKGCLFLDINPSVVYMAILEDGDDKPNIGDVVNGYQKVIDTHYDDDTASGKGTEPDEWGIETLDNPYYLFTIIQPEGSEATIDDENAGTVTPGQNGVGGGSTPASGNAVLVFHYAFDPQGGGELINDLRVRYGIVGDLNFDPTDPTTYSSFRLDVAWDYSINGVGDRTGIGYTEFEAGKPLSTYFQAMDYGYEDEDTQEWVTLGTIDLTQVINAPVYEIDIDPLVSDGE